MNRALRLLAAAAVAATAASAHATAIYSLAESGTRLIAFDSNTPGAVNIIGNLSGATTHLDGMDFRPADGLLYGFNQATSGIYRIDTATGVTTFVSTSSVGITTATMGIDFNPVPDRLRVVAANDQNLRINVVTGVALVDGNLAYAAGDANAGANPGIVDAAYTNHDSDPATGTTLYYIDFLLDTLVSTTNPNGGTLSTIGALGVDTSSFVGFDIFTSGGVNTAFASLTGATPGLYTINLGTGAATLVGAIGARNVYGLAVAPAVSVPEPTSLALLAAAGLAGFALRRRRA